MRNRLFFVAIFTLLFTNVSFAQLVGGNGFLQGAWLEIGECSTGALGTGSSPTNYHAHLGGPTFTPGSPLAEVYDYGHDGWTIGTPPFMGDYTYPGAPFEGWELQFNSGRAQAYYDAFPTYGVSWAYSGGASTSATGLTSYSNAGGIIKVLFNGNVTVAGATLAVNQETRVDTFGSAVVFTVVLRNTSATAANNVYYWRSADPDNDESWPGGGFPTDNVVDFQNATLPNPTHKVSVTAYGYSSTHPPLTLCTKDCRAVACIYGAWGLTVSQDLAALWNETYGASYAVGVHDPGDIAIGLVYNLGNILPGDSAVISYSYVFNGPGGIDSAGALPDPELSINNSGPIMSFPDTFFMCTLPTGVDTLPINILHGTDKDWTWSHWTWTPATGLSATTGVSVILAGSFLTGPTTYTVTGTDSSTGMYSCNTKQFVFTIVPCHFAYANAPCLGDTLKLGMFGDTTGATYYWWGPDAFTSHVRSPYIYPSIWADTGMYYVVKTVAGTHDTDFVHVIIHPLPVVNLASSIPTCAPITSSLTVSSSLDSALETFLWSGPFGFTSTLQAPTLPFDSSMQGTYICTGTTIWGCKTTASINVWAGVTISDAIGLHYGCNADTVYFYNYSVNANTYSWQFDDGSPAAITRNAEHIYNSHGMHYVFLTETNPHCPADTVTIPVDLIHSIHAAFLPSPDTICFEIGATIAMRDSSYAVDSIFPSVNPSLWTWTFGDGGTLSYNVPASPSTTHQYTAPGSYPVKLVVYDAMGCPDSESMSVYVVQLHASSFTDTTLCLSQPLQLNVVPSSIPPGFAEPPLVNYSWWQSLPNLDNPNIVDPFTNGYGTFTDVLTMTVPGVSPDGCPTTDTVLIHSVQGAPVHDITVSQTIMYGNSIQLYATGEVLYRWLPDDGTLDNNNINNPVATPTHTETYTVFGLDVNGCLDSAYVTVYVDTTTLEGLPAAFTPNNDGLNDKFKPVGIQYQHMVEMRIFNRWGQELFYTNSNENGWDGTYHGIPQDMGTYYYMITLAEPGGNNKIYKGSFILVR